MTSRARVLIAAVLFVGFLFGAVFPTRTYLDQRKEIEAAEARLSLFQRQNGVMEAEVARLQNDHEIERIARERFNLVKPGEEAYAVVQVPPKPGDPATQVAATKPAPSAKRSGGPNAVLDWMVSTLQRVF